MKERKALAEAWIASGKRHGVKIGNHIASASITDSVELAAHAESVGCAFICAMPPFFFKPGSARVVAHWMKAIGEAAPRTREWGWGGGEKEGESCSGWGMLRQ